MNSDLLFGFIMGFFFGFAFAAFNLNITSSHKRKKKKDPANWWKYGGDPFDYNQLDN